MGSGSNGGLEGDSCGADADRLHADDCSVADGDGRGSLRRAG